jgi:hypothetical protein
MEQIIAGRFESIAKADATATLLTDYIDPTDICIFYNNPPGQHDVLFAGGDEKIDPAAEEAHKSAFAVGATSAITAGAIGAFGGPIVALTAVGVAAYTGSLVGAMHGMEDKEDSSEPPRRQSGVILAVHVANPKNKKRIVSTLREKGAKDIEHAEGKWRHGDWVNFNPVESPQLEKMAPKT